MHPHAPTHPRRDASPATLAPPHVPHLHCAASKGRQGSPAGRQWVATRQAWSTTPPDHTRQPHAQHAAPHVKPRRTSPGPGRNRPTRQCASQLSAAMSHMAHGQAQRYKAHRRLTMAALKPCTLLARPHLVVRHLDHLTPRRAARICRRRRRRTCDARYEVSPASSAGGEAVVTGAPPPNPTTIRAYPSIPSRIHMALAGRGAEVKVGGSPYAGGRYAPYGGGAAYAAAAAAAA
jgi:hypothetical protein